MLHGNGRKSKPGNGDTVNYTLLYILAGRLGDVVVVLVVDEVAILSKRKTYCQTGHARRHKTSLLAACMSARGNMSNSTCNPELTPLRGVATLTIISKTSFHNIYAYGSEKFIIDFNFKYWLLNLSGTRFLAIHLALTVQSSDFKDPSFWSSKVITYIPSRSPAETQLFRSLTRGLVQVVSKDFFLERCCYPSPSPCNPLIPKVTGVSS